MKHGKRTWGGVLVVLGTLAGPAAADEDGARAILAAMSTWMAAQPTIALTFDSSIEVITPELEKIQFTNSGEVLLARPDRLRASRVGGYSDVELIFDGKTVSVHGRAVQKYAQIEAAGTVDQLIGSLRLGHGVALPGADLLLSNAYDVLIADVVEAKHIGRGVIGGIECDHLAFRNFDTDWQIWIEAGERRIPRKLVISSKTLAGAPQYTLQVTSFATDVPAAADAFAFDPPSGHERMAPDAMIDLDELPPPAVPGEQG